MSSRTDVGRFFRHSTIYALGSIVNRAGAFLLLPLYTSRLSTGEYGTLELYYVIASVVSGLLSVGIAHATLRFYFDYPEQRERNTLVTTNLIASLLISGCGAGLLLLIAEPLSSLVLGVPGPRWAMPVVLATLVLELSSQVSLAYLRARELSVFFVVLSVVKLLIQCIANVIALTQFNAGVVGILFGNFLAVALGWLILTCYTISKCGLRFEMAKVSPVLRYSLPFLYITVLALFSANLDRLLINSLISIEAVGLYALAQKFAKLIADLIGEPFNRAYGSFRFTIMDQSDAATIQARIFRYAAVALAIVTMGVAYFAVDVIRIMAASSYLPASTLVPPLALAAGLGVLTYVTQTGVLYAKKSDALFRITLIRTVVVAVLAYPAIAGFELAGICALALLDAVLGLVLTHRMSQRYFAVQYDLRRLGLLGLLAMVFYGASLPAAMLTDSVAIVVKVALICLFLLAIHSTGVLTAPERKWIRERWRRLRPAADRIET
ncbi:MAG: lipopolysaccharide biosynthesis protein [Sinobacteraceae bacterium]|nr:lipopolysaccharide biosynthesis protein [Nevskiaceae bacterium]MCP5470721.1 lipopolysaccharide biosynthesis protein [Nevskiaceae bacterium]